MSHIIQNFEQLAISRGRKAVLEIAEAGLEAIDTQKVLKSQLTITGDQLRVGGQSFNLKNFGRLFVLGFGKASDKAAEMVEQLLGPRISGGAVIAVSEASTKIIQAFIGTHPLPSMQNVAAAQAFAQTIGNLKQDDLVITLVSGGGSGLLCWDKEECEQSLKLYKAVLGAGLDIKDLNTLRKHISQVKGGGLAKLLYPATVIGLIFCDVPGDDYASVASGPTYQDQSTMYDAKDLIDRYSLGEYKLYETTKEPKYFKKVHNIPIISNTVALKAMQNKAKALGLKAKIISYALYDPPKELITRLKNAAKKNTVILAGGESKIVVRGHGSGGRCQHLAVEAFEFLKEGDVFGAIASDGLDNSACGGAIVDFGSTLRAGKLDMDFKSSLRWFDSYRFLEELGSEQIFSGPTGSNVSDLFIWYQG